MDNKPDISRAQNCKKTRIKTHENHITHKREQVLALKYGVPMKNEIGEHNCFLNVFVHIIYNIPEIREFFLKKNFSDDKKFNILAELKIILERYDEILSPVSNIAGNFKVLDPKEFRNELAEFYKAEQKFEIEKMDDPVELFYALLRALHNHSLNHFSMKSPTEKPCNPPCPSHKSFWINIVEQDICECGATTEVQQYAYDYFIHETYVKEILNFKKGSELSFDDIKNKMFIFLEKINSVSNIECPEKCVYKQTKKNFFLLNRPSYLIFNLIWNEQNPSLGEIARLFFMQPLHFNVKDLFPMSEGEGNIKYELFAVICYWGAHYICFLKSDDKDALGWIYYDDTIIKRVNSWKELIEKCLKSHFHPTMTFYRKCENKYDSALESNFDGLTKEAMDKIYNYSSEADWKSKQRYQQEELASKRLRPSKMDKRKSDDTVIQHINDFKNLQGKIRRNDNNFMLLNSQNQEISKEIENANFVKTEDKGIQVNSQSEKKFEFTIGEKEWLCENTYCKNVNLISFATCPKCKVINTNIYDLIHQQNEFNKYRSPNPIKLDDHSNKQKRPSSVSAYNRRNYENDYESKQRSEKLSQVKLTCSKCNKQKVNNTCVYCSCYSPANKKPEIKQDSNLQSSFNNPNRNKFFCNICKINNPNTFCQKCSKNVHSKTSNKDNCNSTSLFNSKTGDIGSNKTSSYMSRSYMGHQPNNYNRFSNLH